MIVPLAQLSDLLPNWVWFALFVAGLVAPAAGLGIHRLLRRGGEDGTRIGIVFIYYLVTLPLMTVVYSGSGEPAFVCSFLVLLPVGILIGLVIAFSGSPVPSPTLTGPPAFCPSCGYDLRATPDRCPECGTVPPAVR